MILQFADERPKRWAHMEISLISLIYLILGNAILIAIGAYLLPYLKKIILKTMDKK